MIVYIFKSVLIIEEMKSMTLRMYKRPTVAGTLADPLVLSTDGTPLVFNVGPGVLGQYRAYDDGEGDYSGRYVRFVAPEIGAGNVLRILYGVQEGYDLDTYLYVFELSDARTNPVESWNEIASDDDSGPGSYGEFPNTEINISDGQLTPGVEYVLEATTYSDDSDNDANGVYGVKITAEVITV